MRKHFQITVKGRVQGVGFRYWLRDIANELAITGYTQNLPNGDVYIVAEGDVEMLHIFISKCYEGPIRAKVKNIATINSTIVGYTEFSIKH